MSETPGERRPSPTPTKVTVVDESVPHEAWYKDDRLRLFGRRLISNRAIVTALLASIVIVVIVFGWVLFRTYTAGSDTNAYLVKARQDRLNNQNAVKHQLSELKTKNAEIDRTLAELDDAIASNKEGTRDLACSVVLYFRSQPSVDTQGNAFLNFLTTKYTCIGYRPIRHPFAGSSLAPSPGSGNSTPGSGPSAAPSGSVQPSGGSAPTPGPTTTVVRPTPVPGPTRTVTKTPPPPAPAPTPTPILGCVLVLCI